MPSRPVATAAQVAVRVRASVSRVSRGLRESAPGGGLASAKWSVLAQLHRLGPMTPTTLAGHERVRLQTLTRLLAELGAAQLVASTVDASDGRKRLLSLTTAGTATLVAEVHRREASLRRAVQGRLSAAERTRLLDACTLFDRVADALADARGQN